MYNSRKRMEQHLLQHLNKNLIVVLAASSLLAAVCLAADSQPASQPISSRAAFLRAQRASRLQQAQSPTAPATPTNPAASSNQTAQQVSSTAKPRPALLPETASSRPAISAAAQPTNRTTRTADIEDFSIFVTNTCERELMHVNIKTSKPFFGVIHTKNQRQKSVCTTEGNGQTEYSLDISHVLSQQDPNYCGVIKARRESPDDKDLLSVVIAVRVHKNIELSNDKFFLLNCTNRCRRPDCSSASQSSRLLDDSPDLSGRVISDELPEGEREGVTPPTRSQAESNKKGPNEECTIYNFPWVITLLWCLGILLLASLISHCIMCSSMVCRCVKTEVEEHEPSVYEGDTDDEDNLYNNKNNPMRIDYDNRDIYKTSNNYEPYNMDDDRRQRSGKTSSKRTGRK